MSDYILKGQKGIELLEVSNATAAAGGYRRIEARSDGWYDIDDTGTAVKLIAGAEWVNYSGTPLINQLAIFQDANTIAGDAALTYSQPNLSLAVNATGPTIKVQNLGGTGGAQFQMVDDAGGSDWKFKATSAGFKIRDNANSLDVITIENNSAANSIYIEAGGHIGFGTTTPSAKLDVVGNINLENTTTSSTGVITKGGTSFIHNFKHPTGGGAVPNGYNTFVGWSAGNFTMGSTATQTYHSSYNVALGHQAFSSNTTGFYNIAIGYTALFPNTTGYYNMAIGGAALRYNTTGNYNVAIGTNSLYANVDGGYNMAIGTGSLQNNVSKSGNTAVGNFAMYNCNNSASASSTYSTAIGYEAAKGSNTPADNTGQLNTVIGGQAFHKYTTASYTVAIGNYALLNNTTGSLNTVIGYQSFITNTTGAYNVSIGAQSGYSSTGSYNVFIGYQAGYSETGNYKLYIASSSTTSPLIYGDFSTGDVVINGTFKNTAGFSTAITTVTSDTTLTDDYRTVLVDNSAGTLDSRIDITLPAASSHSGREYYIKLTSIHEYSGSDYGMTLSSASGVYWKKGTNVSGTNVDTAGAAALVQSDGTSWWIILYDDVAPSW